MKKRYILTICFSLLTLANSTYAQMVGANVFLQGRYVEVGIALNGSWGPGPAPGGYHPFPGTNLSCVYDYGHDGWTTGTPPYYGDYVYPGTPFEGWQMQVAGVRSDAFYTTGGGTGFYNAGGGTLTGSNLSYSSVGGVSTGIWTGTAGVGSGMRIRQTTQIDTNASWVNVTTVFTNTTGTDMPGLYYHRTFDPDNEQSRSGDFRTNNVITHQNDVAHRVMVGSYGITYTPAGYLALATKDCRAKSLIYQFWPPSTATGNELDLIYSETATGLGVTNYGLGMVTLSQDIAIGLIYNLGTLRAGDSTVISYAFIFRDSLSIDSAFPAPQLVVNGVPRPPTGPEPAPTIDTYNTCLHTPIDSIPVRIANATDKNWTWSRWTWAPSTGLSATTGTSVRISTAAVPGFITYTITGTDSAMGMNNCNNRVMYLTVTNCYNATSNSPGGSVMICEGDDLRLVANGDSVGATYFWYGPTGYTATGKRPIRTNVALTDSGWYYVIRTMAGIRDTARTHVVFKPQPVINLSSNAPICSGNTLTLSITPDSVGETYLWSGPNGFTATGANPTRVNAPVSQTGGYKVVANFNGCIDSGIIAVVIDSTPALPVASSNTPICSQRDSLKLTATCATPFVSYFWNGPMAYTSPFQNPNIVPNVSTGYTGTYTVTVRLGTCTNTDTTIVLVKPTPVLPIMTANRPCSGNALNLTATDTAGSTYDWAGPNSFSTTVQNPTINPASTSASGVYSVSATLNGCTSDTATLTVAVDSTPVPPTATSNSPGFPGVSICEGDTLRLFGITPTAGATYSWVGPSGFVSSLQNPIIPNVTVAANGVYMVTASLGPCFTTGVTTVTVTTTPLIFATNNGPVCTGDSLKLFATTVPAGATFTWSGPYTFRSTLQNPTRENALMEYSGIYKVIAFKDGCFSKKIDDTVTIRQTPPAPWMKWIMHCQYYDAPPVMASGDSILWYLSSVRPLTGGTLTPPVPSTTSLGSTYYYATQTVMGCTSILDSMRVSVFPRPTVTMRPDTAICQHDTLHLTAINNEPLVDYHWTPKIYLSDTASQTVVARPETNITYTVVVTNQYTCRDSATIFIRVFPGAMLFVGDSVLLYPGETHQINPQTNCTRFAWSPAAGLSNTEISNPLASPTSSTMYVVNAETPEGCRIVDSLMIHVSPESALDVPNAFVPGSGPNGKFRVVKRGIANLNFFRIFNRWGNMVFETTDINAGWDGTLNGVPQPMGVYMYQVSAVTSNGLPFTKKGNVTLIR